MPQPLAPTLRVPTGLLARLIEEANNAFPLETGGILLGRQHDHALVVTHVIGPGPKATHLARSFTPDRDWQYDRLDAIWAESRGQLTYLGDWHTHPNGTPTPSRTDRTLLQRTAQNPACQCPQPVMLILAGPRTDNQWIAGAHQYRPRAWAQRSGSARPLLTEIVGG